MKEQGWFRRKGVKILEGKWQDFMENSELLNLGGFDIVFTDTFAESYQGMYKPN
jgi:type IV protein arginine methyltransferase